MLRSFWVSLVLAAGASGMVWAQAPAAAPATGGIQSANIFDIKPDANTDPNYPKQTNAERGEVQPGNNAPMWRQVGAGETSSAYSSLPTRQAPEAAVLVQPFVQYPGSRLTNGGEAWRQVPQPMDHSLWRRCDLHHHPGFGAVLLHQGHDQTARCGVGQGDRAFHLRGTCCALEQRDRVLHAGHLWSGDGVRQVHSVAGHGQHAVRMVDLCAEERAQLHGPAVRGVAGGGVLRFPARQLATQGRLHLDLQGRWPVFFGRGAFAPLQRG